MVLFLAHGALLAQDSGAPDNDFNTINYERSESEMGSIGDPEGKTPKTHIISSKDSSSRVQIQRRQIQESPKESKTQMPGNSAEDDSILSFNFLYFFIQKFKLQDIID